LAVVPVQERALRFVADDADHRRWVLEADVTAVVAASISAAIIDAFMVVLQVLFLLSNPDRLPAY